jgi:hypothetical protein
VEARVTIWDDYIREIEQDLAERRRSLEPLKSGQMRLGERRTGTDPWVDTTKREISRREKRLPSMKLFWSDCALNVKLRANIKDKGFRPPSADFQERW